MVEPLTVGGVHSLGHHSSSFSSEDDAVISEFQELKNDVDFISGYLTLGDSTGGVNW